MQNLHEATLFYVHSIGYVRLYSDFTQTCDPVGNYRLHNYIWQTRYKAIHNIGKNQPAFNTTGFINSHNRREDFVWHHHWFVVPIIIPDDDLLTIHNLSAFPSPKFRHLTRPLLSPKQLVIH